VGGTGLEPVTPSLSRRSSVRTGARLFGQTSIVEPNRSPTERLSEREQVPSVAIVATRSDRGP